MFKSPLIFKKLPNDQMQLTEPLIYEGSAVVVVPAGFITDGASVPKGFRWFVQGQIQQVRK